MKSQSKAKFCAIFSKKDKSSILTAEIATPVFSRVKSNGMFDELKNIKIRFRNNILDGFYDSDAQISVVRADVVKDTPSEGEGRIDMASAFGER